MAWKWKLGVNSSFAVTLYPTFGYKADGKQNKSMLRTPDATLWEYKWGQYDKFSVPVNYVSSSDTCTINSWWGARTDLNWYQIDSANTVVQTHAVRIMNNNKPLNSLNKPYIDQFKGKIDLESY